MSATFFSAIVLSCDMLDEDGRIGLKCYWSRCCCCSHRGEQLTVELMC